MRRTNPDSLRSCFFFPSEFFAIWCPLKMPLPILGRWPRDAQHATIFYRSSFVLLYCYRSCENLLRLLTIYSFSRISKRTLNPIISISKFQTRDRIREAIAQCPSDKGPSVRDLPNLKKGTVVKYVLQY